MKTTRKLIALVLCALLLIPCFSFTAGADEWSNPFTDVPDGKWYSDSVKWAYLNGYFAGTSANTFSPDGAFTRAQLVVVLSAIDGADISAYKETSHFADVALGKYYTAAVEWAFQNGVVSGKGEGRFAPDDAITRQEICVMIRAYINSRGITLDYVNEPVGFTDSGSDAISSWALDAVSWAQRCGLVSGMGNNKFSPKTNCTRAQATVIIKQLVLAITDPIVIAYYNATNSGVDEFEHIDVLNFHPTTIGNTPSSTSAGGSPFTYGYDISRLNQVRSAALAQNPDIKILFTVANNNLQVFESWLMPYDNCQRLADYFVDVVRSYGFDGVDIDYEFPSTALLRPNYVRFIENLREGLNELAESTGKDYLITMAVPGGQWTFDLFDMNALCEYVDFFNIMDYDLNTQRDNQDYGLANHHEPAYNNGTSNASVYGDIQLYLENGIPADKIVPGIGMYSRKWNYVFSNTDGLLARGMLDSSNIHYTSLISGYVNKGGYVRYWDDVAKAPYLYNSDTREFITYDDEESVAIKCDIIRNAGVRGIMVFDYCTCDGIGFFDDLYGWLNPSN